MGYRMRPHGFLSGYATSDEEIAATANWTYAMDKLMSCDNKQAAVLALEVLDRIDQIEEHKSQG